MAREFDCPSCGAALRTSAPPGKRTLCKACGARPRLPLSDAGGAPTAVCPECGAEKETRAEPGKRTRCKECGADFRIPLPGVEEVDEVAEERAAARPAPVVRRTCPACGERVSGQGEKCPECGATMGLLTPEAGRDAARHLVRAELGGGLLVTLLCGGATVHGLSEGWISIPFAIGTVIGLGMLLHGATATLGR